LAKPKLNTLKLDIKMGWREIKASIYNLISDQTIITIDDIAQANGIFLPEAKKYIYRFIQEEEGNTITCKNR
jgi:hypothetical protein